MSSLRELLTQEGFNQTKPTSFSLHICHDSSNRMLDNSKKRKGPLNFHNSNTERICSASEILNSKSLVSPPLDEVAIRAVISILSGYIGRYAIDEFFRKTINGKCSSHLVRRRNGSESDGEILANLKLAIESIDKLVNHQGTKEEVKIKSLRNSIDLLTIVSSLNSKASKEAASASTCGIPNSHLSACAQLYLAIVYKLQKNKRVCARHLLQVFCDSPFLARTYLLPELWEHMFLPHLLHLKIWYTEEIQELSSSNECHGEKEKKMKYLRKVYDSKMDAGTAMFALYYKQWLKVGANEPPLPIVTLPSRTSHKSSMRRNSDSNLSEKVFGHKLELKSATLADQNDGVFTKRYSVTDEIFKREQNKFNSLQKEDSISLGRSSRRIDKNHGESRPESQRLDYFHCFSCRNVRAESLVNRNCTSNNASFRDEKTVLSTEFVRAIKTISSSDILSECEFAIRVITKAWLNSHGDPLIEEALTQTSVIEAMLEALLASSEDEILEMVISVLAELVRKNDRIRQIILCFDPQLEIFLRLLRSTVLFLKASVLLYLLKPPAKQMLSPEWVPLVLRVLEYGDKVLTLFTVQCNPQVAAMYFLEQLLHGFDEEKNLENVRQVVSLGGMMLLMRRIEEGEFHDRNNAALIILRCIRAEGSCRSFLAENINKASLLELIVIGNGGNSSGCAFSLLAELLYLDRKTKILNFLRGLKDGCGGLNTMHILIIYLQRAPPEERPLVATIILLLDLMEDPFKESLYRAEAIEAIVVSLNCKISNDIIQEQSARALHLLAGHFSYTGESLMEKTLLQQAGFQENCLQDSSLGKEIVVYGGSVNKSKEDDEAENWRRRTASVLFKSGNKNLLSALAHALVHGIPSLAKASLITISWMSCYLHSVDGRKMPPLAFSIFTPALLKSLNYDKDVQERVLTSYSLLCLVKYSGIKFLPPLESMLTTCL